MSNSIGNEAQNHIDALAKPPGSLGQLETLAIRLSQAQKKYPPTAKTPHVLIFAGDHGVTDENISAYPSEVTLAMIATISSGRSAVGVLAKQSNAQLRVINVGAKSAPTALETPDWIEYVNASIGEGTKNLSVANAMTLEQSTRAQEVGRKAVRNALEEGADILVVGEMGIGNTTAAAAIVSMLLGISPEESVGPGTGLDQVGVERKKRIVAKALKRPIPNTAEDVLSSLGGFEIAAMVGAMLEASETDTPVVLDGYIASAAALVAVHKKKAVRTVLIPATCSAEPGHQAVLHDLGFLSEPLLEWGLRLGEGSAATLYLPLLRAACAICSEMATLKSVLNGGQ